MRPPAHHQEAGVGLLLLDQRAGLQEEGGGVGPGELAQVHGDGPRQAQLVAQGLGVAADLKAAQVGAHGRVEQVVGVHAQGQGLLAEGAAGHADGVGDAGQRALEAVDAAPVCVPAHRLLVDGGLPVVPVVVQGHAVPEGGEGGGQGGVGQGLLHVDEVGPAAQLGQLLRLLDADAHVADQGHHLEGVLLPVAGVAGQQIGPREVVDHLDLVPQLREAAGQGSHADRPRLQGIVDVVRVDHEDAHAGPP